MTSMRVSATPLIANSLVVGDSGLGVEGINIPGTGEDGPSVLFQYVTLPADDENEFRMLVTSQPSVGTLTTFEDSSFIYEAPDQTVDSFNYEWFKDGVSQGSDTVNVQIGGGAAFELSPQVVNSSSVSINPEFVFNSAFNLNPSTVNSTSVALSPSFTYTGIFNLSPDVVNSNSITLRPSFSFGQTQTIGTVTASFAPDLYTAKFKS